MSSFAPSQAETALVSQIFSKYDPQQLGIVTGDVAVKVFSGSKLPATTLGEIWALADKENNGFLTRKGVSIALRLIGHAQKGESVSEALIDKPGPLATIEGITKSPGISSIPASPTQRSSTPLSPSFAQLNAQDKAKFARLFLSCGPVNGLLSGDKAREVFLKSKLPFEKLSQIWNLADSQSRGALDQADFTIAMYLVQASMSGQLKTIPAILPPSLYEQAGARLPKGIIGQVTGNGITPSPAFDSTFRTGTPLTAQITGQSQILKPQSTGQRAISPSIASRSVINPGSILGAAAFSTSLHWDVKPEEKTESDKLFDGLDTQKRNYIEGDIAVPFLLQSKLSEEVLAQVWDLADLNNDGRLTRDGFAVAMHLIHARLAGKDVPQTLPESLIPPAMRGRSATQLPVVTTPETNLLLDDTPPASAINANLPSFGHTFSLQSQTTGQIVQQSTGVSTNQRVTSPPLLPQTSPFVVPNATGNRDFLSDDDDTVQTSSALHDKSAEIGNLRNQLDSTNKSLEKTKLDRQEAERALANQASQLSSLQTQISSSKAAYETESRLLLTLRERFSEQTAEIQKEKEELIRSESDLSALKEEKAEVGGSLLRDKDEVRSLQKKMKEIGDEIEQIKSDLEKVKKEAKQQKGLLAIAKKQLSTREAELAKMLKDAAEAQNDLESTIKEKEETEAAIISLQKELSIANSKPSTSATPDIAALLPLPNSPEVISAVTSPTGKSNNPFDRLVLSSLSQPSTPTAFQELFGQSNISASQTDEPTVHDPFGLSEQEENANQKNIFSSFSSDNIFDNLTVTSPATDLPTNLNEDVSIASKQELPSSENVKNAINEDNDDSFSPETAASQFPAIEIPKPAATENLEAKETDLESLHEIEHNSESDSDDEHLEQVTTTDGTVTTNEAAILNTIPSSGVVIHDANSPEGLSQPVFSEPIGIFDDKFGMPDSVYSPPQNFNNGINDFKKEEMASQILDTSTSSLKVGDALNGSVSTRSGINAFDEALGNLPKQQLDTGNNSTFGGFEDNFDFSAVSAANDFGSGFATSSFLRPPSSASSKGIDPAVNTNNSSSFGLQPSNNGHVLSSIPEAPVKTSNGTNENFDDVFNTGNVSNAKPDDLGITFEDAFGSGNGASKALAFDDAFRVESNNVTTTAPTAPKLPSSITPFPSLATRSNSGSVIEDRRSTSPPPRQISPPPRLSSPKLRPSSKDGPAQDKPSTRHSKLSIRLPFGRNKEKKKTKQDTLAVPPENPSTSEVSWTPENNFTPSPVHDSTFTPPTGDDVEPVRILCGMGFTRAQAVTALELHGYDVQKAINSLLGTA